MDDQAKRNRMRIDLPEHLNRAARARAGFDGVDVNVGIAKALELYLKDEIETLRKKQAALGSESEEAPKSRKK